MQMHFRRDYCMQQPLHFLHLVACLSLSEFSVACLHSVSLCWLMCAGRAGMSMDRGIRRLMKDFRATVRCVRDCVCVCVEGLGGIVVLKSLMWRLMQRDNTGFVSIVPMSLVSYSLAKVYSNPMVREESGGGLPVLNGCGMARYLKNRHVQPLFICASWFKDVFIHSSGVTALLIGTL